MDLVQMLRDLSNYCYRRHGEAREAQDAQSLYEYADAAGEAAIALAFYKAAWSRLEEVLTPDVLEAVSEQVAAELTGREVPGRG